MERVGTRVSVFWEGEGEWFEGVVADYDAARGFFVQYDDGEEQWEVRAGGRQTRAIWEANSGLYGQDASRESAIHFLSRASAQQQDATEQEDAEEEYADDHDEYEQDDDQVLDVNNNYAAESPTRSQDNEANSVVSSKRSPMLQPREQPRPRKATSYASNTLFFRDEETLREMLRTLQQEKQALTHEYRTTAAELSERELRSKELKRELDELKALVTLANIVGGSTRASTAGNPLSSVEWKERVMDQKLSNRQLAQQIAEAKACLAMKKTAVAKFQKTRKQHQDALARVPRRDLCTLVDMQVELAQLMAQKRALEAQKPSSTGSAGKVSLASADAAQKQQLEDELCRLEGSVTSTKDEIHASKLRYERQQACIRPLQDRLMQLQQELKVHQDGNVLLRSVFQRLHPTVRDGSQQVLVQAALEALAQLAPNAVADPNQPPVDLESIRQELQQQKMLPDETMAFEQFVHCFQVLFQMDAE